MFEDVEYRIEPREIKARLDAPVVQAVIKMGYSRDVVRKVIEQRLTSTGEKIFYVMFWSSWIDAFGHF